MERDNTELDSRESDYFNESDDYVYSNSVGQQYPAKAYKEKGFWWFAKNGHQSPGDVKCTSVLCRKIYQSETQSPTTAEVPPTESVEQAAERFVENELAYPTQLNFTKGEVIKIIQNGQTNNPKPR